jgi:hypothetical protein
MDESEYYVADNRIKLRYIWQAIKQTWMQCYRISKIFFLFYFLIVCPIILFMLLIYRFKKPPITFCIRYPGRLNIIPLEKLPVEIYQEVSPKIQFFESHDFRFLFLLKSNLVGNVCIYSMVFLDSSQFIWSGLDWGKVQTKDKKTGEVIQKTECGIGFNSKLANGTILRTFISRDQMTLGTTTLPHEHIIKIPKGSSDVDLLAAHRAQNAQHFSSLVLFNPELLAAEMTSYSQELFRLQLEKGDIRPATEQEITRIRSSEITMREYPD